MSKKQNDKVSNLRISGAFYFPIEDLGITEDEAKHEDFPDNLTDEQQENLWGRIFYPYTYLTDLKKPRYERDWSWMVSSTEIYDQNDEGVWDIDEFSN